MNQDFAEKFNQMIQNGDLTDTEVRTIMRAMDLMDRRSALSARLDQIVLRHNSSENTDIRSSYVTALKNIEKQVKGTELAMVRKRQGMLK